jgi:hypothetical protein
MILRWTHGATLFLIKISHVYSRAREKKIMKQYQRPTPSVSVPIASVVGIIVIIFMMGRIATERPHIRFVENNAEQVVTNPARIAERKLDNVYFCAAPFYDQQERIH